MKTDTKERMVNYITTGRSVTIAQLVDYLGISPQAIFKHLRKLIDDGKIQKIGRPPRVFYSLAEERKVVIDLAAVDTSTKKIIDQEYLTVTPRGQIIEGMEGFANWCQRQDLAIAKTAQEYRTTLKKYAAFKRDGLINGMEKMSKTFAKVYLDELYYLDFYSIERFGKTRLGSLILYAKQSQSRVLIKKIATLTKDSVHRLAAAKKIDAVGFIPPTIPRKIQLQKEIQRVVSPEIPRLSIIKTSSGIPIAQKSLSNLKERETNARDTIFINDMRKFKNILLIDDAVGSGATLNETAKKIRDRGLCTGKIIGLAMVGSFKGFDVIQEI